MMNDQEYEDMPPRGLRWFAGAMTISGAMVLVVVAGLMWAAERLL